MAGTKEIKDRIKSIKDTQKITNAMYLISSTKMRKAKQGLENTEPYFYGLQGMMARVLRHMPKEINHPYLRESDKDEASKTHGYLVITADKGLAGAYNHNVLKMTEEHLARFDNTKLFVIGELGRQYFENRGIPIDGQFMYTAQNPTHHRARIITRKLLSSFSDGEIDDLHIVFTAMKNSIECETRFRQLLPLTASMPNDKDLPAGIVQEQFLMQPSPENVLDAIVPNYINGFIYSALVESYCAEQNSRMMAMQNANDSANDILHDLSIQYNRERQAAITQEITEVCAGAKAQRNNKR